MTREEAVIQGLQGYIEALNETIKKQDKVIKALEQQGNTWSLDDAREDFMHDVYNTLDFLPTNNEANRIIDSFDRVTSDIKQQPSDDCVSRSDVLTLIDDTNLKHLFSSTRGISQKAFEDLLSGTKALPPATPTHGWIPVNGKLPKQEVEVLTCSEGGFIEIQSLEDGYWENQHGDCKDCEDSDIIAWQPLPKPYEEKRGSEND